MTLCLPNQLKMQQYLQLIEAIVVIVAFGLSAIIVETTISIFKSLKQ